MAGDGGYQQPANPAMVSGPGPMSQRTDGGPGSKSHPLPQAQYSQQPHVAPTPSDGTPPPMNPRQARALVMQSPDKEFLGPSNQPETPVTDGASQGAGRGPEALYQNSNAGTVQAVLAQLAPLDQSGAVQALMAAARAQGA